MRLIKIIGLRIGQISFPTQVDTGYGDFPQGIIQVNDALMKILRASGMAMHPVTSDVATVGCSGSNTYERWQIEQEEVSIATPAGIIVANYASPLLEVKTDARCGGISTFAEPFAQIGAFWLSRWGIWAGNDRRIIAIQIIPGNSLLATAVRVFRAHSDDLSTLVTTNGLAFGHANILTHP